jgi:hypothetical protein
MKFVKRFISILLVTMLFVSATGCDNTDKTWVAKYNDTSTPIGVYIYYLYLAYDRASEKVDPGTEVLSATIDGEPAETWIKAKAMTYIYDYFWIENQVNERNLALTADELSNCKQTADTTWTSYGTQFEKMGISETSFNLGYAQYNMKYKKVFDSYYGETGEFAVSKDTLKEIYENNNYSYAYMYASLTKTDESSNTVDLSDDEKSNLNTLFSQYQQKVQSGYMTVEEAASEYAMVANLSESPYTEDVTDLKYAYYPEHFTENLEEMTIGEVRIFETDGQLILLQKNNVDDAFETDYSTGSKRLQMLLDLKNTEFTQYVDDHCSEIKDSITLNQAAIDSIKISSIVTDSTKYGTESSTDSSTESSS